MGLARASGRLQKQYKLFDFHFFPHALVHFRNLPPWLYGVRGDENSRLPFEGSKIYIKRRYRLEGSINLLVLGPSPSLPGFLLMAAR